MEADKIWPQKKKDLMQDHFPPKGHFISFHVFFQSVFFGGVIWPAFKKLTVLQACFLQTNLQMFV